MKVRYEIGIIYALWVKSMILGQIIAVRLNEVIDHFLDGVDIKLCGTARVKHRRLIDVLTLFGHSRFDGKKLNVDVGHIHRGTLYGESANVARMNTMTV